MRKRVYIAVATLFVVALGVGIWGGRHEREPVYRGRSLPYWIGRFPEDDSVIALVTLGSNSAPTLSRMLRQRDSLLKRNAAVLLKKQRLVNIHITLAEVQQKQACRVINFLGATVKASAPALAQLLKNHPSTQVEQQVIYAMDAIGPTARETTVPVLLWASTNASKVARLHALRTLGRFAPEDPLVQRALIAALEGPDPYVSVNAAMALLETASASHEATNTLSRLLDHPEPTVRMLATNWLQGKPSGVDTHWVSP